MDVRLRPGSMIAWPARREARLTCAAAQVYSSHMQLGGPRVMGVNGVSHHTVADDLEGVTTLLRLLAYTPAQLGAPHAPLPSCDPADRSIGYCPSPTEKLDPRAAIAGG
jgi:acetyl-CoA carboxylase/biotin carboxylase 1